jgi:hypothetical protein
MLRAAYGVVYQAPLYGIGPGIGVTMVSGAYILIGEGLRRKYRTDRNVGAAGRAGGLDPTVGGIA